MKAQEHLGLVNSIASYYYKKFAHQYSYDDIFQWGCIGLVKAINNFDNSKKCKFSTYAYRLISGNITNEIRNDKWYMCPRRERFENKNTPISLNNILRTTEDDLEYIDILVDENNDYDEIDLKLTIRKLPIRLAKIIELKYFEDMTNKKIARRINMSEPSVCRLEKIALEMLKHELSC